MTIKPKKGWKMKILLGIVLSAVVLLGLDINKASLEELTQLKGIGEKKAQAIVEYRKEHKCFNSIQEMLNVKGIGPMFIKRHEKTITLSACK
jgi:competence protein ComEA